MAVSPKEPKKPEWLVSMATVKTGFTTAGQMSANPDDLDQKDTQHRSSYRPAEEKEGIVLDQFQKTVQSIALYNRFHSFPKGIVLD